MTTSSKRSSAAAANPETPATDAAGNATLAADAPSAPAETEAPATGETAVEPAADETTPATVQDRAGRVKVVLAHPLDQPNDLTRLRLDQKDGGYKVGEEVWVLRDDARTLITAGYAQVDPENNEAVAAVLDGKA